MLINKESKEWEDQSNRAENENWMGKDWVCVPKSLQGIVKSSAPYCILQIENSELVGVVPTERPPAVAKLTAAAEIDTLKARTQAAEDALMFLMDNGGM